MNYINKVIDEVIDFRERDGCPTTEAQLARKEVTQLHMAIGLAYCAAPHVVVNSEDPVVGIQEVVRQANLTADLCKEYRSLLKEAHERLMDGAQAIEEEGFGPNLDDIVAKIGITLYGKDWKPDPNRDWRSNPDRYGSWNGSYK